MSSYVNYIEAEDIYVLTEDVYHSVMDQLGIVDRCIIQDANGSRNTRFGVGLYMSIEKALIDHIEVLKEEENEII
jgi:hypothetical protein